MPSIMKSKMVLASVTVLTIPTVTATSGFNLLSAVTAVWNGLGPETAPADDPPIPTATTQNDDVIPSDSTIMISYEEWIAQGAILGYVTKLKNVWEKSHKSKLKLMENEVKRHEIPPCRYPAARPHAYRPRYQQKRPYYARREPAENQVERFFEQTSIMPNQVSKRLQSRKVPNDAFLYKLFTAQSLSIKFRKCGDETDYRKAFKCPEKGCDHKLHWVPSRELYEGDTYCDRCNTNLKASENIWHCSNDIHKDGFDVCNACAKEHGLEECDDDDLAECLNELLKDLRFVGDELNRCKSFASGYAQKVFKPFNELGGKKNRFHNNLLGGDANAETHFTFRSPQHFHGGSPSVRNWLKAQKIGIYYRNEKFVNNYRNYGSGPPNLLGFETNMKTDEGVTIKVNVSVDSDNTVDGEYEILGSDVIGSEMTRQVNVQVWMDERQQSMLRYNMTLKVIGNEL